MDPYILVYMAPWVGQSLLVLIANCLTKLVRIALFVQFLVSVHTYWQNAIEMFTS